MSARRLAVIVLAAGQGTRMKSATPKVLHTISGRSLIGHVLHTARDLAPEHTILVVRHERDRVAAAVEDLVPGLRLVDQDEVPGTGRAVELALAAVPGDFDGDVVVLSGDVPLVDAATIQELLDDHRRADHAASLLTARLADPSGYGRVLRSGDGSGVDRIVEQADATAEEAAVDEVNSGTYAFRVGALRAALARVGTTNAQGEKYLTDVIGILRRDGARILAHEHRDTTVLLGVNDRSQLAEAERIMNARIVRAHQLAGVTVRDPATTWIDVEVTIGQDTEILPDTQLRGATTIGAGAVIGPDTTITDTEIGDGARVSRTDATLAVIGAGATVGPFAYLRPGAVLGEGGKIGTYVEVKNSTIGVGSKVPHLSYIGDAEIGEGTNIGAGAITANYDGKHKHRTRIGDRVHTGVHNAFVAPVEVGDDATVGAGAVIRRDVPPGALAITAASQKNIADWVPPYQRAGGAGDA
ncbi:MAG TPA: bifunctional UDP-N-acetylglucosamine diphosphorylase/glucosamine-1-phosphate N-acetyltransferase GlmU [Microbacteriaceae bacterium]|nr:bifunctional UDP-N-acetylglucosamine diphosphorylase/glucosamine-1-phosphate N-acetyltransferase GlmU [Microbacteriaceae bacterium]